MSQVSYAGDEAAVRSLVRMESSGLICGFFFSFSLLPVVAWEGPALFQCVGLLYHSR